MGDGDGLRGGGVKSHIKPHQVKDNIGNKPVNAVVHLTAKERQRSIVSTIPDDKQGYFTSHGEKNK